MISNVASLCKGADPGKQGKAPAAVEAQNSRPSILTEINVTARHRQILVHECFLFHCVCMLSLVLHPWEQVLIQEMGEGRNAALTRVNSGTLNNFHCYIYSAVPYVYELETEEHVGGWGF